MLGENTDLIITYGFLGLGLFLLFNFLRSFRKVTITDKTHNFAKAFFILTAFFSLMTLLYEHDQADLYRMYATLFCTFTLVIQVEGLGENGIVSLGKFFPYSDLKAYDIQEAKRKIIVIFIMEDFKQEGTTEFSISFAFSKRKLTKITQLLDKKMGKKKYRRMKH